MGMPVFGRGAYIEYRKKPGQLHELFDMYFFDSQGCEVREMKKPPN